MTNAAFTAHEITVNGKTFPAEYSISPSNTVFAFVTVQENGQPVSLRIKIDPTDPNHAAALAAAQQERSEAHPAADTEPEATAQQEQAEAPATDAEPEPTAQQEQAEAPAADAEPEPTAQQEQAEAPAADAEPEPTAQQEQAETPAADAEPEPTAQQEQTEAPARNPKQARGPVPEKNFIGLEIKGNGWKIVFDGSYDRTRVIFKRKPSLKAREAVKNAGFYWSPSMQSWNKNLTFRAWRAAQSLAMELKTICG